MVAAAQEAPAPPPQGPPNAGPGMGSGNGMGRGSGRGGGWMGGMGGRGVGGTVSEVAADHYTIKTVTGETFTVHYSANTRVLKQPARAAGGSAMREPPQEIKPGEIRVGDAIMAMGEMDAGREIGGRDHGGEDRSRARARDARDAGELRQDLAGGAGDGGE